MAQLSIALDLMGGDDAPEAPARAALQALELYSDIRLLLLGPRARVQQALAAEMPAEIAARLEICEAPDAIGMDESPVEAVRRKPASSLVEGTRRLAAGRAEALVTAGNSGAAVVAGMRQLGLLPGIERPALAVLFPCLQGETVLLDVGAQVTCRPRHLEQFARLGVALARHGLGVAQPRVGLINIGEEAGKGHPLARESWQLLQNSDLNFVGNLEGWDLPRHRADVAVCDGFTGNVMLKLAEGLGELFSSLCPDWPAAAGEHFDSRAQGGALVLGVDGLMVVAHGRSQSRALVNAIGLARRKLLAGTLVKMRAELAQYQVKQA